MLFVSITKSRIGYLTEGEMLLFRILNLCGEMQRVILSHHPGDNNSTKKVA